MSISVFYKIISIADITKMIIWCPVSSITISSSHPGIAKRFTILGILSKNDHYFLFDSFVNKGVVGFLFILNKVSVLSSYCSNYISLFHSLRCYFSSFSVLFFSRIFLLVGNLNDVNKVYISKNISVCS